MGGTPVRRGILALDIEGFGQHSRTDPQRAQLRARLHGLLDHALASAEIGSTQVASRSDLGDGILMLFDPAVPAATLLGPLLADLTAGLAIDNQSRSESGRLRLRVAVHEGHVLADAHGHSGEAVNHTFRLLDAQAARAMLAGYPDADAVLIISDTLYQEVVRHAYQGLDPAVWQPVGVHAKETRTRAWVHLPGLARQPDVPSALAGDGEGGDDAAAHQGFTRRYLDHVISTLGRLELFGITRNGTPSRHPIDRAYVSLAVARSTRGAHGGDDEELTGAGIDVLSAFEPLKRVVVCGGAGSGKSTLLDWLAVRAARDAAEGGGRWGPVVPYLLRLRQYAHTELPALETLPDTVAGVLSGQKPDQWVSRQFDSGRALLLVDGVDELEPTRRPEVKEWLEQLVTAYEDARYVVTTRPFAIDADWLTEAGFVTFDLLPLSQRGIRTFLSKWHDALRAQYRSDEDTDIARRAWLDRCEQDLTVLLSTRPELRSFAASPLLCGLLCALHHDYQERGEELPGNRKGLYDAALELLLVRWDKRRRIQVEEFPPLSLEEQIVLLQRFAYHLVKNHKQVVSRGDATEFIGKAMRGFRSKPANPEPILQRLLERTGLLRAPDPDMVQFLHRTFQDYLAAKDVVDSGDLPLLVDHAHEDDWHEVVVSFMAHADLRKRDRLLEGLLKGNTAAQGDRHVRDRLHLVAAACLEQADVVDTDEVRQLVRQAAAGLIPPQNMKDADLLAKAGGFVLDLLPGPERLSQQQAAAVVRTVAMIGGDRAWDKLAGFVEVGGLPVIDELLRAWRQAQEPERYARTVLTRVDFGESQVSLRAGPLVQYLHLTGITNLTLTGDYGSLEEVAAMPRLRRLALNTNGLLRDLGPLAACPTLRTLELSGGELLQDLSSLEGTSIEELALYLVRADLGTLRARRLRHLRVRDPRLRDGLAVLPAHLPLRKLTIYNLPNSRNLLGIDQWRELEHVAITGIPRAEEVQALARLPRLRHLTVRQPESGHDLAWLEPLASLRRLDLEEVPAAQAGLLLEAARRLPPAVEVRVNGRLAAPEPAQDAVL